MENPPESSCPPKSVKISSDKEDMRFTTLTLPSERQEPLSSPELSPSPPHTKTGHLSSSHSRPATNPKTPARHFGLPITTTSRIFRRSSVMWASRITLDRRNIREVVES